MNFPSLFSLLFSEFMQSKPSHREQRAETSFSSWISFFRKDLLLRQGPNESKFPTSFPGRTGWVSREKLGGDAGRPDRSGHSGSRFRSVPVGGIWGPRRRRGGILGSRRNTGKNRSGRSRPAPLLLDQGKGQYGFNANLLAQKSASRSLISKAQINVPGGFSFPFFGIFSPSILKERGPTSKNREEKKKPNNQAPNPQRRG